MVLTPNNTDSHFYTQLGCMDARAYGGMSLRISAPSGRLVFACQRPNSFVFAIDDWLEAFRRDVARGGNLVMHFLHPSTVGYLQQFIQIAKATGKQLMRVDQCMMDPNAPPL